MKMRLDKLVDHVTPQLALLYARVKDKSGLHAAVGLGILSLAKRAFNDPGKRPAGWAPKADGTPSRLRRSGTLAKSVRVITNASRVTVGSDRHYAAIHQLGGRTRPHVIRAKNKQALHWPGARHPVKAVKHPGSNIPARPYLPFYATGQPTPAAGRVVASVLRTKLMKGIVP